MTIWSPLGGEDTPTSVYSHSHGGCYCQGEGEDVDPNAGLFREKTVNLFTVKNTNACVQIFGTVSP